MRIEIISFSKRGYDLSERIAAGLGYHSPLLIYKGRESFGDVERSETGLKEICRRAFDECVGLCFVGAAGIALRSIASFVNDKYTDPPVLVVDEWGRHVVPLLSGHVGGANALANEIAEIIKADPVITTASELNAVYGKEDAAAGESALPMAPPAKYVLGIGCRKGKSANDIESTGREIMDEAGIGFEDIYAVSSIDIKRRESGLLEFVERHYLTLLTYSADELQRAKGEFSSSEFVKEKTGTDNVCERAAVCAAGEGGALVCKKRRGEGVTAALALRQEKPEQIRSGRRFTEPEQAGVSSPGSAQPGQLSVVGIGPSDEAFMTPEAMRALEETDVIAGYDTYVRLVKDRFPGKEVLTTPMRQEVRRVRECFEAAASGKKVSLICSGDPGVYGMASPALELAGEYPGVEVKVISGITAANSGAAVLGAPLANDYCAISLSDLLTPWEVIEKRIRSATEGDLATVLYNPMSKKRTDNLRKACEIILEYRDGDTACGYVKNIGRKEMSYDILSLTELKDSVLDMSTTVFIGNSKTMVCGGRLVTPRGYDI